MPFGRDKHPTIKIVKRLGNEDTFYKSAVIVSVDNGLGALRNEICEGSPDWHDRTTVLNMLTLNGIPLLQYDDSACPTCAGLLAAGYGIENVDCPELRRISEAVNEDFVSLERSVEILIPLLGMLETGIYMIADVPHFPTDGGDKFFWNVPSENCVFSATCSQYYIRGFYSTVDGFPAYLYPTQGTNCYNPQRVEEYIERFGKSVSRPRAIAYSHYGFISALLDGHHKACAAALLGESVDCITIIPVHTLMGNYDRRESKWDSMGFQSDVIVRFDEIGVPESMCRKIHSHFPCRNINPYKRVRFSSDILNGIPDKRYLAAAKGYPALEDMSLRRYFGIDIVTREMIDEFFDNFEHDPDVHIKLKTIIRTEAPLRNPLARYAAMRALRLSISYIHKGYTVDCELDTEAVLALMYFKDDEIEQLMIDLLVNEGFSGKFADLVKSYWD